MYIKKLGIKLIKIKCENNPTIYDICNHPGEFQIWLIPTFMGKKAGILRIPVFSFNLDTGDNN